MLQHTDWIRQRMHILSHPHPIKKRSFSERKIWKKHTDGVNGCTSLPVSRKEDIKKHGHTSRLYEPQLEMLQHTGYVNGCTSYRILPEVSRKEDIKNTRASHFPSETGI
ncbi:hypothetical protein CDAR_500631 [Caerostris darwini]|uniref:Uncharacterized protein n=1 Tax=Caerostris darwini TaxID=1538125 RepID=A0AAV4VBV9_9ARAC|nr:hypothetical protein CDAR_500631 [Caerostris darwini]